MNIIQKLISLFRGGLRETAEVIIDTNSLRIFAQEIHDCEEHIRQSKQQLATIIAEKMQVKRNIQQLEKMVSQYEQRIVTKLNEDNNEEALQLAEIVAEKEANLDKQKQHHQKLLGYEDKLQKTLKKRVNKLDHYRSELRMAKATANLQSAQSKLSKQENSAVSHFGDMQDSLSRIQQRQQQFSDEIDAMEQINTDFAHDITENANETSSAAAQRILERVKNKAAVSD